MPTPLKRHPSLIPLSKDHHFGLLLSWKIRQGIRLGVEEERMVAYVAYFCENHLLPHFHIEEQVVFPFLMPSDPLRMEAEKQHEEIRLLLKSLHDDDADLSHIAMAVEQHIRFEERQLFQHMQESLDASSLQLLQDKIASIHQHLPERWNDPFLMA